MPHFGNAIRIFDLKFVKNLYQSISLIRSSFFRFFEVYMFGMSYCITPAKKKYIILLIVF